MIYIGTSGFRFSDWKGHFYPEGLKSAEWLDYYATRFNCLEVNSTYYRNVHPSTFVKMAEKTPEGFRFTVKAHQTITHERGGDGVEFDRFVESLQPLQEVDKFGCVLAQFPSSFHRTPENLRYLESLAERFGEIPVNIEFRHREWAHPEVFDFLRRQGMGFCCVDEPRFASLMPPAVWATSPIGYVRFHGRNYQTWWKGGEEMAKLRYDYLYSEEELREWLPKLRELEASTQDLYIFMNNCYVGQAATNALQLAEML